MTDKPKRQWKVTKAGYLAKIAGLEARVEDLRLACANANRYAENVAASRAKLVLWTAPALAIAGIAGFCIGVSL